MECINIKQKGYTVCIKLLYTIYYQESFRSPVFDVEVWVLTWKWDGRWIDIVWLWACKANTANILHTGCSQVIFGLAMTEQGWRCSCGAHWDEVYDHRPTSACTTYQEYFQYWSACTRAPPALIHEDPMRAIPNPFGKAQWKMFSALHTGGGLLSSPTLHFSRPTSKELALALMSAVTSKNCTSSHIANQSSYSTTLNCWCSVDKICFFNITCVFCVSEL